MENKNKENKENQKGQENSKEGTDDFGSDLDTDGFRVSGLEGLERDKRGELVVLLPDEERSIARQRGFFLPQAQEAGDTGTGTGARRAVEKGSQFTGVLVEEPSPPAPPPPAQATPPSEPKPQTAPPPVDLGPTQVIMPDNLQKATGPTVQDFDLDFGSDGATAARRKRSEDAAPPDEKARKKVRKTAAWAPPEEEKAMPPPVPPTPQKAPEQEPPKDEIPFEEPELPEHYSAPVVLKRRRAEKAAEKTEQPEPDKIKARSYLDDERVIEDTQVKTPPRSTKKKKKMKLPKKIREGRKTSPLLVLMLILLILVLAGILAVQYVPEARVYYEKIMADITGGKQAGPAEPSEPAAEDDVIYVRVGSERVPLCKESDKSSAEAYTKSFREAIGEGRATVSGKAK